jgi:hypothetical protein
MFNMSNNLIINLSYSRHIPIIMQGETFLCAVVIDFEAIIRWVGKKMDEMILPIFEATRNTGNIFGTNILFGKR